MRELSQLIERVEKATGPDREIDRGVAQLLGYTVEVFRVPEGHPVFKEGGGLEFMVIGDGIRTAIPPWTSSLDAVVALVESNDFGANCHGYDSAPTGVDTYVSRNNVKDGHWIAEAHHKSRPLALLLAFLKAKQSHG